MTLDNAATRRRPVGARRLMPLIVWASVALGVLVLILTGEMGNMVDAFSTANWWLVAPLLAVGCALPVVHAKRWQIMLRALEHELSLESTVDLTITSTMINYAAPGYLWSPAKGLLARQMYGIGLGRSVPTLAVEQVVDALASCRHRRRVASGWAGDQPRDFRQTLACAIGRRAIVAVLSVMVVVAVRALRRLALRSTLRRDWSKRPDSWRVTARYAFRLSDSRPRAGFSIRWRSGWRPRRRESAWGSRR